MDRPEERSVSVSVTVESESPIFIVGVVRSGTTLARSILCGHPRITIPPETLFFDYCARYDEDLSLSKDEAFEAFWRDYVQGKWFPRLELEVDDVRGHMKSKGPRSAKAVFESMMEAYARKMGKARWGEKTPGHEKYLRTIFQWYPHARVLFMVRDPRAVSASVKKVPWGNQRAYEHARWWKESIRIYDHWKDDDRVLAVRFEDLLSNPAQKAREICEFLAEDFHPAMLQRSERAMPASKTGGWTQEYETQVLRPIDPSGVDKWRSSLSKYEVGLIEHLTEPAFSRLGYKRQTKRLTVLQHVRLGCARLYRSLVRAAWRVLPSSVLRALGKG